MSYWKSENAKFHTDHAYVTYEDSFIQEAFRDVGQVCPDTNAYKLSQRILSLPCHTKMIPKQAARIAQRILSTT